MTRETKQILAIILIVLGVILCVTLVGIPFGIPMIVVAYYIYKELSR